VPASILDEIIEYKREFVEHQKKIVPLSDLKSRAMDFPAPPVFAAAIHRGADEEVNVIAEIKKKSPSKGIIREDFDPLRIAIDYAEHGAAAISVLTDEKYFDGRLSYLREIRAELEEVPLLRKEFIIDEYQVYEARDAGAAAILLIAAVLDRYQLVGFRDLAKELGMSALTEVHLEREADLAAEHGARIIGINNRDLRDFSVDIKQTEKIIRLLGGPRPGFIFVAESGISEPVHVDFLRGVGVDAMLVGEGLMRQPKPGEALSKLLRRDEQSLEAQYVADEQARRLGHPPSQRGKF
jgi:indole-3-glycerol phosphate synthase